MTGSPRLVSEAAGVEMSVAEALLLCDWKREVGRLYAGVRDGGPGRDTWERWRAGKDRLYARHGRSPVPAADRPGFPGLAYFGYDPAARVLAGLRDAGVRHLAAAMSGGADYELTRFAVAEFELYGSAFTLDVYWIAGFRGGLFLPFADATNGRSTYGGGRYLVDTLKGEDLGVEDGKLVLDFNYAYHPLCVFNREWSCPLPPPGNRLPIEVAAGERLP